MVSGDQSCSKGGAMMCHYFKIFAIRAYCHACFVVGAVTLSYPSLALADLFDAPVFQAAEEVDDSALAEMRGRYVTAGKVINFGVVMRTDWQMADGTRMSRGIEFGLMRESESTWQPYAIETSSEEGHAMGRFQPTVYLNNGLDNVDGVVQAIQIEGVGNQVDHGMTIELVQGGGTTTLVAPPVGERMPTGYSWDIPGVGRVSQGVSSSGFIQHTQLTSHWNQVTNTAQLRLQFSPGDIQHTASLHHTLNSAHILALSQF